MGFGMISPEYRQTHCDSEAKQAKERYGEEEWGSPRPAKPTFIASTVVTLPSNTTRTAMPAPAYPSLRCNFRFFLSDQQWLGDQEQDPGGEFGAVDMQQRCEFPHSLRSLGPLVQIIAAVEAQKVKMAIKSPMPV